MKQIFSFLGEFGRFKKFRDLLNLPKKLFSEKVKNFQNLHVRFYFFGKKEKDVVEIKNYLWFLCLLGFI